MNHQSFPLFLIATLLCGCSTEKKTADWAPSSRPTDSVKEKPALADYVDFPTLGIKLRQPEGFEKAESFDGFGQPDTQSSVMAVTIAGPHAKFTAGFTQDYMKERGLILLSRQDVKLDGLPGILIHFEQPAAGNVFLKWSVAFGDDKKTTMVTATFPKALEQKLSARLKSAVLSTRVHGAATPGAGADLPFTVAASQKLKFTPLISKTLGYTRDGVISAKSPRDPLFVVAPSLGKVAVGDKREFAERRLDQTAHTKGISIKSTDAITIDGLDGYESLAEAEDVKSGTPLVIYQLLLFDEGSYILMQGLVGTDLRDEYLPEFKAMARSFKRKQ